MAKEQTRELTSEELKEQRNEAERKRLSERVKIQLFKDTENNKDDQVVQINGDTTVIKRGFPVMVTRAVAEVLDQASYQMLMADQRAEAAANVNLGDR